MEEGKRVETAHPRAARAVNRMLQGGTKRGLVVPANPGFVVLEYDPYTDFVFEYPVLAWDLSPPREVAEEDHMWRGNALPITYHTPAYPDALRQPDGTVVGGGHSVFPENFYATFDVWRREYCAWVRRETEYHESEAAAEDAA